MHIDDDGQNKHEIMQLGEQKKKQKPTNKSLKKKHTLIPKV